MSNHLGEQKVFKKYYPGKLSKGFTILAKAGVRGAIGEHRSQEQNTPMQRYIPSTVNPPPKRRKRTYNI